MSPSSTEPLRAALSPDRVSLVQLGGRKGLLRAEIAECAAAEHGEPIWAPALRWFRDGLAGFPARPSGIRVVLSNHFVRYVLVPWRGRLNGNEEELAHARHCFEQVYGGMASAWEIRLSPCAEGESRVACAVDAELLSGLDQAVAAAGKRLRSVQPYLMSAFNRWRREFDVPQALFVLAEPGRMCLAIVQNGRWVDLRNQYAGPDWAVGLPAQLARERALANLDGEARVCVCALDEAAEKVLQDADVNVHIMRTPLPAGVPEEHAASVGMALCR